jgi:hypothetical protein
MGKKRGTILMRAFVRCCFWASISFSQCCGTGFIESGYGYGYGSGSSISSEIRIQGFDDKNWRKKITAGNNLSFFDKKIAIYLSLGLIKERLSYWRSLQPSEENIQHFKKWN